MTALDFTLPKEEPVVLGATMVVHDGPPDENDSGSQDCRNVVSELC